MRSSSQGAHPLSVRERFPPPLRTVRSPHGNLHDAPWPGKRGHCGDGTGSISVGPIWSSMMPASNRVTSFWTSVLARAPSLHLWSQLGPESSPWSYTPPGPCNSGSDSATVPSPWSRSMPATSVFRSNHFGSWPIHRSQSRWRSFGASCLREAASSRRMSSFLGT